MTAPMLLLYDDAVARTFEPFASTRPLGEVRAGALLVRERWAQVLGVPCGGFVSSPGLDGFQEFDAPAAWPDVIPAGTWLVNSRALPPLDVRVGAASALAIGEHVAALRLLAPLELAALGDGNVALDSLTPSTGTILRVPGQWLDAVWDIVRALDTLLPQDITALVARLQARALPSGDGVHVTGPHGAFVEEGAVVEPMTLIDTTAGPVLLRRGARALAFTRLVGPLYVGADSTVMGDRIGGSAIGEQCRVHGEVSACTFIGYANKGHDGFLGHSVVGRWVNLGAGTITSNLKNTYGSVALWTPGGVRESGLQFLGTLFGDHVKTGIGSRLTTGCVLGAGANVYDRMPPKVVAPFAWGGGAPYDVFAADKFVATAQRMMQRRGVTLDDAAAAWWRRVHAACCADLRWPR